MQLASCSLIRFRLSARVYHVYRQGTENPSPLHQPITGDQVRAVIGQWLTREFDDALHWRRMVLIYQDHAVAAISAQALTRARFGDWLVDQIIRQRFRLCEELPPMRRGQSFEEYARVAHVPVVAAKAESTLPPPSAPTPQRPYGVMSAPGGPDGLKNERSPECPSSSFRSERVATAHPMVIKWFKDTHTPQDFWDDILGGDEGGGFLVTTTRVVLMNEGTVLFRYFGGTAKALSTWWFAGPFEGDPRAFAALPPDSSADQLVKARVKKDIMVLTGIGAPRCSNKPGGPVQYFVQFQPARTANGKTENDFLELI